LAGPQRWRNAAQLLPAIDRHGGLGDYQPLSLRAIHTRLTRAAHRATVSPTDITASAPPPPLNVRREHSLEEVLVLLDQVADDADALNARIEALLR
jgi:hypothetical protein